MNPRNTLTTVIIIAFACFLSGCNTPMTIRYTPVASVATLRSADAPKLRVAVARFSDAREDPETIGANRNLYGMRINKVQTTDDLGQILAEATTDALDKAGLDAELRTAASAASLRSENYDAVIVGRLTAIDVDTKPGWNTVDGKANISLMLTIWKGGQETEVGPISGEAKQGTVGADITNAASQALDGAIQNCIRSMINELRQKKVFN